MYLHGSCPGSHVTSSIWSPNLPLEWNLQPKASQQTGRQDKPRSGVHEVQELSKGSRQLCWVTMPCAGDQGTDLGHCWTGTLQGHHQCVRQMKGDKCGKINRAFFTWCFLGVPGTIEVQWELCWCHLNAAILCSSHFL